MASYQRMLFVCLNDRGEDHPKGSCARAGGDELLDRLRAGLHERGLKKVARAVGTRCLGQCSHGPVVCVHPEDVWYGGVRPDDAEALIDGHVLRGEPLEARRLKSDELTAVPHDEVPLPPFRDEPAR